MNSLILVPVALFLTIIIDCENHSTEINNPSDRIGISTDRSIYAKSDTLNLTLANNSSSDITVGLRCGVYLEMYYQRRDNREWSRDLWFSYMTLRCLTLLDTVETNKYIVHSIPAEMFDSTGTFRLIVDVHAARRDSSLKVVSNAFEIR